MIAGQQYLITDETAVPGTLGQAVATADNFREVILTEYWSAEDRTPETVYMLDLLALKLRESGTLPWEVQEYLGLRVEALPAEPVAEFTGVTPETGQADDTRAWAIARDLLTSAGTTPYAAFVAEQRYRLLGVNTVEVSLWRSAEVAALNALEAQGFAVDGATMILRLV